MVIRVAAWKPCQLRPAVAGVRTHYGAMPYYVFVIGPVQAANLVPKDFVALPVLDAGESQHLALEPIGHSWVYFVDKCACTRGGADETRGWAPLPALKQKTVKVFVPSTVKLSLFREGRKSRLTFEKVEERRGKAMKRYDKNPSATWKPW